ncbi:MAG: shikimate dehydrogenase family protein [Christensenellales bacterium]
MRVKYDVDTKLVAQIGYPMDHSCASMMHNALYEYAHLNAVNLTFEVPRGGLGDFVQAAKALKMVGFDITMPYKSEIIPFLDECTEEARAFSSVNHVKITDGKLSGVGLDGVGMRMAIEAEGVSIKGRDVLILGAGAVSGPIAAELCKSGAKSVTVLNRTADKAKHVADTLKNLYKVETAYGEMTASELNKAAQKCSLVVQCTSLGMHGSAADYDSVDFISLLPGNAFVADVLYNPYRTKILAAAEGRGLGVVNGAGMMFYQERAVLDFMFGVDLPDDFVNEAEESILIGVAMRNFRKTKLQRKAKK